MRYIQLCCDINLPFDIDLTATYFAFLFVTIQGRFTFLHFMIQIIKKCSIFHVAIQIHLCRGIYVLWTCSQFKHVDEYLPDLGELIISVVIWWVQ